MSANTDAANAAAYEDALQELFDVLSNAYWDASTLEGKDMINGCVHAIADVLTQLHQVDFSANTPEFNQLANQVGQVNKKLVQLKNQIDQIIHRIQTATTVLQSITTVLNLAGPLFG